MKPSNKVEPKFHEGDWVVFNNKHQSIYQVEKIENGYYILRHTHGGSFRVCVLHDESLRLWTIKDAKDGDVLASDNGVIILVKESRDSSWGYRLSYYCAVLYNGTFEPREFHVNPEKFFPATKEQRNTLFAKMKDAGYTFDKKALKKEVEPKFEVGDTIAIKHNPGTNKIYFTITDITGGKYWYNDRIICDITEQDEWELEVDVEKEIVKWWEDHYKTLKDDYKFEGYLGHFMENSTIISLAQHFFELGLKINKGE